MSGWGETVRGEAVAVSQAAAVLRENLELLRSSWCDFGNNVRVDDAGDSPVYAEDVAAEALDALSVLESALGKGVK